MVIVRNLVELLASASSILAATIPLVSPDTSGKLPVLGYNTWNAYGCNINAAIILQNAEAMVANGMLAAGYNHFNIDDCWQSSQRDAQGHLVPDPVKFPGGMIPLTTSLKALGFAVGIYSDNGYETCGGYPGSYGHELMDATDFVAWGFTLLKFDNCHMVPDYISQQNQPGKYALMANAITQVANTTGIKLQLNLCNWGTVMPWTWAKEYGTSWRSTNDIESNWASIMTITNIASFIPGYTDFYGRNDFDILEVGNGALTFEENKSHFTIWALTKSHLLLGTNLANLSPALLQVVTNPGILAINQDVQYCEGVTPFRWSAGPAPPYVWEQPITIFQSNPTNPAAFWSGRTSNGVVVLILNTLNKVQTLSFDLVESPWLRAGIQYNALDLYTGVVTPIIRTYTASIVNPHGIIALLLTENGREPAGLSPACQAINGYNCQ